MAQKMRSKGLAAPCTPAVARPAPPNAGAAPTTPLHLATLATPHWPPRAAYGVPPP
ncbi:MAG: hypothetical protein KJ914_14410 [Gammaproteobacteria bacterium]|nr:hypothetical protein [Gammaproteobacteria bacterium]MBU1724989.1 hypothetical protein [Gammaproteobacteria bacterium]MBU2007099.1 hypothetical protein [Gammaproteobacteria bacterium]